MSAGVEQKVSQDPVIRHYRGTTRQEVEQAYRADAAQALRRNYLPLAQDWSHDWQGFLLAVTYRHEDISPAPDTSATTTPASAELEEPVAESPTDEAVAPMEEAAAPYAEPEPEPEPESVAEPEADTEAEAEPVIEPAPSAPAKTAAKKSVPPPKKHVPPAKKATRKRRGIRLKDV